MTISLRDISKRFGAHEVLKGLSLEVQDGELFFLLGPSGCGKTTLLRLLAGFYQPDAGELRFGTRLMNDVPPHQRNAGMVFQNYALWPHLSVADNVGYGLDVRGVAKGERRQRVQEALETVRMEALADRAPNQLSGGQQQRVALARALVIRPDVLLLDEPLSNLDARLRLELRDEIRRIHSETGITTVYVTHDQKESLSLADRLAVLRDGVIEQVGPPRTVYRRPASRFVADFIGETNWLEGEVTGGGGAGLEVATALGPFRSQPGAALAVGTRVWLGFRPESLQPGDALFNSFAATVRQVNYLGEIEEQVLATAGGLTLKSFRHNPPEQPAPLSIVTLSVPPANVFVLPRA